MSNKFIGCEAAYNDAEIVILGAPYDGTASYRKGSAKGPSKIREEAYGIETYSPYQDKDLTDCKVCDWGNVRFHRESTSEQVSDIVAMQCNIALADGKLPILLGGEHSVSLGAIRSAVELYPDLRIIHFDAHTDLRDDYEGEKFSHACVMKRAFDLIGGKKIYQYCIRSGEKYEFEFAKRFTTLTKYNFNGLEKALEEIGDKPIYLSIDLDCLDPSEFPGTGTPEAGGVKFNELLVAMMQVCKRNVVAADLVELAPNLDPSGISTALTCKLLRELILALVR